MPRIKLIATGGTIVNTRNGLIGVEELLKDIPQARERAEFDIAEVARVRGGSIRFEQWLELARAVAAAAADPAIDGVIFTHGTFTLEETVYFVHLCAPVSKPVVCVASQRTHDSVGNDGDRNFLDAVRVALSPEAGEKGVLVVLHEEIHSARDVVKTNQRPGGFSSPAHGLLGHIETDRVSFYRAPLRRHTFQSEFDIRRIERLPRVDVVAAYVGADEVAVRAFVDAGARGLVVHGYAFNGNPAADQKEALQRAAAAGIPVVCASRGGQGRVPISSEDDFIRGDTLPAHKARILLTLALTRTSDPREIQRIFNEY
ncbi:MAG TPA: asparaginase [Candidatus Binatia bacterium]|jgi:L-asparaginase